MHTDEQYQRNVDMLVFCSNQLCHHNSFYTITPTTMPKSILKHSKSVVDMKPLKAPKSILKTSQSLTDIKRPRKKVSFVDTHTPKFKQRLIRECDRLLEMIDGNLREGEEAWYWKNDVEKDFPQY